MRSGQRAVSTADYVMFLERGCDSARRGRTAGYQSDGGQYSPSRVCDQLARLPTLWRPQATDRGDLRE